MTFKWLYVLSERRLRWYPCALDVYVENWPKIILLSARLWRIRGRSSKCIASLGISPETSDTRRLWKLLSRVHALQAPQKVPSFSAVTEFQVISEASRSASFSQVMVETRSLIKARGAIQDTAPRWEGEREAPSEDRQTSASVSSVDRDWKHTDKRRVSALFGWP